MLHTLSWVSVQPATTVALPRVPATLCAGDREAIALALGQNAPLLLLDGAAGRSEAKTLGIRFTGILDVLVKGNRSGLIAAVRPHVEQLERMGFYIHDHVRQSILRLAEES